MSSLSLEERKRKLAEARAAREAKDKQVVELGEQLAKMQSTSSTTNSSGAIEITASSEPSSALRVDTQIPVPNTKHSSTLCVQSKVAIVDVPPTPQQRVETYSKALNTDPVFVYTEERPDTIKDDENSSKDKPPTDVPPEVHEPLGSIPAHTVWDGSALAQKLLKTQQFLNFIDTAASVMEATKGVDDGTVPTTIFSSNTKSKSQGIISKRGAALITESLLRDPMVVVAVAFQPGSTDTFAVAYGAGDVPGSTLAGRQHDAVSLWNVRKGLPIIFTFRYEIHALCFVPSQAHMLIGGSAKGHVVMWDVRNSASPCAVTFPSLNSHNMPITHMRVVGDSSKSSLVTISLDGRVCLWNLGDLKHPVASMVICSAHSDTARMSITSASVPYSRDRRVGGDVETSRLYFGGARGTLHVATRNVVDRRIIASNISSICHDGSINAVDTHPNSDMSHTDTDSSISTMILSASSDWSCRIWQGDASIKLAHSDIVLDARWCPTRPNVFASCDASGCVSLWDLLHSTQAPLAQITLEDSTAPGGRGPVMLHRLAWDDSGEFLVAGGNQGECYYLSVNLPEKHEKDGEALGKWISRNLSGEIV